MLGAVKIMKFKITLTIDIGDDFINKNNKEEVDWLLGNVINYDAKNYYLHSNEIGDELGEVVEVNNIETLSDEFRPTPTAWRSGGFNPPKPIRITNV